MTRDDIRKLAAKKLPCLTDRAHVFDGCGCRHCCVRPTVEAALIEACEGVLEEAASIADEHVPNIRWDSSYPVDVSATIRKRAAALKGEPNDG